jgi:hypothetical protein
LQDEQRGFARTVQERDEMAQALAERRALKRPEQKTEMKADWLRWGWLRWRWMARARLMEHVAARQVEAAMKVPAESWMHSALRERTTAPWLIERTV